MSATKNRLKILRLNKGITQEQLANFINDRLSENEKPISKMVISNWENNKHTIKPDKAQQLADFFEVNVGYLLGYEDKPFKSLEEFIKEVDDPYSTMRRQLNQIFDYIDPKEKELLYSIAKVFENQKGYYDKIENKED